MPCTHPSTANKYVSALITDIVTFYFMIISPVSCRAECKDDGILKQSHRSDIKRCCERDHVTLEGVLMCVLHLHRLSPQMPEKKTVMTHLFFQRRESPHPQRQIRLAKGQIKQKCSKRHTHVVLSFSPLKEIINPFSDHKRSHVCSAQMSLFSGQPR